MVRIALTFQGSVLGVSSVGVTPVPISNTAVKPNSADDTPYGGK